MIFYYTEQDGSNFDLDKTQVANKLSSSISTWVSVYYPVQLKLVVNNKTVNKTKINPVCDFSSRSPY